MVYFWQMYTWDLYWCMESYFSGQEGGGGGGLEYSNCRTYVIEVECAPP